MQQRLDQQQLENISMNGINLYETQIRNQNRAEFVRDRNIYGLPLETSSFICRIMRLDIPENQYGNYDKVVEDALERINGEKIEIHFTPNENNVYRKLRFIYDKIVSDTKNHICNMLKLRETPELCKRMTNEQVIQESSQILRRYGIEINEDLKNGEKIKFIEDTIYELRTSGRMPFEKQLSKNVPLGGNKRSKKRSKIINKSRRRNKSKSRRRNKSKSRRRNKSKRYKK